MSRWFMIFLLACLPVNADKVEAGDDTWRYIENDTVRVGIDLARGGGIGHFSYEDTDNLVNQYDTGRFIQQSYYGDPDGSRWSNRPWVYNPVQGGSYDNTPGKVIEHTSKDGVLYTKTIPGNWARPGQFCPEAEMEQWITAKDKTVHIRFKMTYTGEDQKSPRKQEMPAVFLDYYYDTLVVYDGQDPWTGDELTKIKVEPTAPPKNQRTKSTENWFAYLGPNGKAVGVYTPGTENLTYYRFRGLNKAGPKAAACSYFSPLRDFTLTNGLTTEYDVYLTYGSIEQIRERFAALRENE